MQRKTFSVIVICSLAAACGGSTDGDSDVGQGSAAFYVQSYRPTAGSSVDVSYERRATFTQPVCATTKIGLCTVNPCYESSPSDGRSALLPNAGKVSFDGAEMTSLVLEPQSDGDYATNVVDGQLPWMTGGESVTFQWAHLPGNAAEPGGSVTLGTPPYIALTAGSAFAVAPSTLVRSEDLTLSWTSDSSPVAADQVAVDVMSGSTQIFCIFDATAGEGVIPTIVLQALGPGAGTYNVHSKEAKTLTSTDTSASWVLGFNVDAYARAGSGLAMGSVTIE